MRSKDLNRLVLVSVCYLVSASVGAALAIATHLPAGFLGILKGSDVARDFVGLTGTALSPALFMLAGQAVLTACALRRGRIGLVGVGGLVVLGACYTMGELGEPIAVRAFTPATFNAAQAVVVTGNVVFPVLMIAFGVREWRSRSAAMGQQGISTPDVGTR